MIFEIGLETPFPPVELAEDNGLLAVGGDLSTARLIKAYSSGIFPWFNRDDPILWWSPDPRFVIFPNEVVYSKSMRKILRDKVFHITADFAFNKVIAACSAAKRKNQPGTWITDDMADAYTKLYRSGFAHSFEAWQNGELVGGAYGVAIGKAFFGESMFHRATDASKVAFVTLCRFLDRHEFRFIDCQQATGHLLRFGATPVRRNEFLRRLEAAREEEGMVGKWEFGWQS